MGFSFFMFKNKKEKRRAKEIVKKVADQVKLNFFNITNRL